MLRLKFVHQIMYFIILIEKLNKNYSFKYTIQRNFIFPWIHDNVLNVLTPLIPL